MRQYGEVCARRREYSTTRLSLMLRGRLASDQVRSERPEKIVTCPTTRSKRCDTCVTRIHPEMICRSRDTPLLGMSPTRPRPRVTIATSSQSTSIDNCSRSPASRYGAVEDVSVALRATPLLGQLRVINNVSPCDLRVTSRTSASADGGLRPFCESHCRAAVHVVRATLRDDSSSFPTICC